MKNLLFVLIFPIAILLFFSSCTPCPGLEAEQIECESSADSTWDSENCMCNQTETCDPTLKAECEVEGGSWDESTCSCQF